MSGGAAIFLCHRSGRMAEPWAEAGYRCFCVDVQHSIRKDRVEGNIHFVWGDARSWCPPEGIDIAFVSAEPPCTDVAGSGARDWQKKGLFLLSDALELFAACRMAAAWSGAPYMVENPVGALAKHMGEADHTFHPFEYAGWCADDNYTKRTCLWTGNGFVMPARRLALHLDPPDDRIHKATPSDDRADTRAETPRGFARAVFEANRPDRVRAAA